MTLGIILAIFAMLSWGFGDFLIQRGVRTLGDFETLFCITFFGSAVLLPFVWSDIGAIFHQSGTLWLLVVAGGILFIAALLEFEALKRGKISVIEPTWSIEIPVTALFAFLLLGEALSLSQIILILSLMTGLFLVSYRGKVFSHKFFLEKGVIISLVAASVMGIANFFVGFGARESDPLMVNFVVNIVAMIGSGAFLLYHKKFGSVFAHVVKYPKTVLPMVVLDNAAWIAFAFAMTLAPIGIATAISESYIIIAVLLGFFINKEKLERHQKIGLMVAVVTAGILASTLG